MSATNSTTHYNLPVFLGSDKPAWLVDWNGAMSAIDSAIYEAKQTADSASSAAAAVASDLSTLSTTVSGLGTDITTISGSLTTLIGTVNTITSLIGNGEPTTTDKTIIGAINEINAKIPSGGSVDADDVTYDNTSSGLSATNVQDAIDELASGVGPITESDRVVVIADSYGDSQYTPVPFLTVLGNLLNLGSGNYYPFFSDAMGYSKVGNDGYTALTFLQSKSANIADHDTITKIIFTLGINDTGNTELVSLASDLSALAAYCKSEYPNAKIYMGYAGNVINKVSSYEGYMTSVSIIKSNAPKLGCHYIKNLEYVMHDCRLFSSDGVHPSNDGAAAIANHIYAFLKGLDPDVSFYDSVLTTKCNAKVHVYNGRADIELRTIQHSETISITSNWNAIDSNGLANFAIRGDAAHLIMAPSYLRVGNAHHYATLGIKEGGLYFIAPECVGQSCDMSVASYMIPITLDTLTV